MRWLALAFVLAASCAPPPVVAPSPSPAATAVVSPSPTPTLAPSPSPAPTAEPIAGLSVHALGTLRGEVAWVLRAVTLRGSNTTTAEIWAVPLAGGEPRLAASYRVGPFNVLGPVNSIVLDRQLTRLGTVLVLERPDYDRPARGLVVIDVAAGTARLVGAASAEPPARYTTPAWSPDMTRLAFVPVGDLIDEGVVVMRSDGSGMTQLVPQDLPRRTFIYGWPDDAHVAFGRAFEGASYEVVRADTKVVTRMLQVDGWLPPAPADWWRDRPRFAGAATEGSRGGEARIVVADDVGTDPRVVAREAPHPDPRGEIPVGFSRARWNPRTGEILFHRGFSSDTAGPFENDCLVVSPNGGVPARVPLAGDPHRCEWLPSGDRVAYLHGDTGVGGYAVDLRVAARDGSGERVYTLPPVEGAGDVRILDLAIRVYD